MRLDRSARFWIFAALALITAAFASQAAASHSPRYVVLDGVTVELPNQGDDPKVFLQENFAVDCAAGSIVVADKVDVSDSFGDTLNATAPPGYVILAVSIKSGEQNVMTVTFSADNTQATATNTQNISNYVIVFCRPDQQDNPPICILTGQGVDNTGAKYIQVTVQDPESGIQNIAVNTPPTSNVSVDINPAAYTGSTAPILITATKVDQSQGSFLKLTVTNGEGLTTTCDPPIPAVKAKKRGARATPTAASAKLTLRATSTSLPYGKSVTLSGRVGTRAGQPVAILAQACGFSAPVKIGTTRTTKGGAYAYRVDPMINTTFTASAAGRTSARAMVRVKPKLVLKRLEAGVFRAEVFTTNGQFLNGRAIVMERAVGKRWEVVTQERLEIASSPFAMTLTSALTFRANVAAGSKLRITMSRHEATCYDAAVSGTITS